MNETTTAVSINPSDVAVEQRQAEQNESISSIEFNETLAPEAVELQRKLNRVLKPVFASYVADLERAYEEEDYELKAELYADIAELGYDNNVIWLGLGGPNVFVTWQGIFGWNWGTGPLYYTAETSGIVPDALEELREVCGIEFLEDLI